jgi:hypothetical protein
MDRREEPSWNGKLLPARGHPWQVRTHLKNGSKSPWRRCGVGSKCSHTAVRAALFRLSRRSLDVGGSFFSDGGPVAP